MLAAVVAAGTLSLPAATTFGAPGFHQVLVAEARLPRRIPAGKRLVLTLRDASRPRQRCSYDHPLSGCATVDWADDPSRPRVPPSGVFLDRLLVGEETYFLTARGALARRPDPYEPG